MGLGRWQVFGKRRTIHEATRRAWCRLAYVTLAAMPVLVTLLACVLEYVPLYQAWRAQRYAAQLSQLTGLVVQVERVELLSPTQRRLHGLEFQHPETGQSLGNISSMWVSETAGGCAIKAQSSQFESEHLHQLSSLLHENILCRPFTRGHAVVMWLDGLVLNGSQGEPFEFKHFRLELRRAVTATTAKCTFERAGLAGETAVATFVRQHTDAIPTSQLTFHSGGQYLPGAWVHDLAPQLSVPGSEATLRGNFAFECNQFGWTLRGDNCRLQRVDSLGWFDRPVLAGAADIELSSLAMTDRQLKEISGRLLVQNGQMHVDMVQSAKAIGIYPTAQMQKSLQQSTNSEVLSFTKLGCEFRLDSGGLYLTPLYRDAAIAFDEAGPIAQYGVSEPNFVIPMGNLVVFFSMDSKDKQILESPTVKRLVQWLPSPPASESRTARVSGP